MIAALLHLLTTPAPPLHATALAAATDELLAVATVIHAACQLAGPCS